MTDRNMFYAELIEVSADKGPYMLARAAADGDEFDVRIHNQHGVASNPLKGSLILVNCPDGDLGKAVGMIEPPPADRIDQQKEGEVRIKNLKSGKQQTVELDDDGNILMTSPNGIIHINPT